MAGGGSDPALEAQFTGFSKYFNTTTNLGRANIAKVTYAGFALFGLYYYIKPKPKPATAQAPAKK